MLALPIHLGRTSQQLECVAMEVLHLMVDRKQRKKGPGTRYNLEMHAPSDPPPPGGPTWHSLHHLPKVAPQAGTKHSTHNPVGDISNTK
jgi:hypothetical protein